MNLILTSQDAKVLPRKAGWEIRYRFDDLLCAAGDDIDITVLFDLQLLVALNIEFVDLLAQEHHTSRGVPFLHI